MAFEEWRRFVAVDAAEDEQHDKWEDQSEEGCYRFAQIQLRFHHCHTIQTSHFGPPDEWYAGYALVAHLPACQRQEDILQRRLLGA